MLNLQFDSAKSIEGIHRLTERQVEIKVVEPIQEEPETTETKIEQKEENKHPELPELNMD